VIAVLGENPPMSTPPAAPTWTRWRDVPAVVFYPHHLKRTVAIALIVGTVLFGINQLDVVVRGDATAIVWIKVAVTYLVPFCVSNAGVLVASRRPRGRSSLGVSGGDPHRDHSL
jgi:hypothetical protein